MCALLHDIGDTLGSFNHADIAAAVLRPFVSEANHWMLEKHGVFQGYYFFHHIGLDRNMREQFRGHPAFEQTAAKAKFAEIGSLIDEVVRATSRAIEEARIIEVAETAPAGSSFHTIC